MSKEYNENQILNDIQNAASRVEIPDSVKPDNMMQYIASKKEEGYFEGVNVIQGGITEENRKRKQRRRLVACVSAVAAVLAVVLICNSMRHINGGTGALYELYNKVKVQNEDGVYVLSSYKDLATYTVATDSKHVKQTVGSVWNQFVNVMEGGFTLGSSKGNATTDGMVYEDMYYGSMQGMAPSENYSDTNSRTEGVGEADVVKTDGQYIYYLRCVNGVNEVQIVKADGADSSMVSSFAIDEQIETLLADGEYFEYIDAIDLLIDGDKLVVIVNYETKTKDASSNRFMSHYDYDLYTAVLVYDVSDVTAPQKLSLLNVNGEYTSCKYVDGYVYVFTEMYRYDDLDQKTYTEDEAMKVLAPTVNGEYIEASEVYVAQAEDYDYYNIIVSVDLESPEAFADVKAILGDSGNTNVYVSLNNIYIISNMYQQYTVAVDDTDSQVTSAKKAEIVRVSYDNGILETTGRTEIAGELGDEFDIDEYNGYLRMAVSKGESYIYYYKEDYTYYDGSNWVDSSEWMSSVSYITSDSSVMYVLDENLELVGEVTLQQEEEVYGVRFDGDIAYVVTYRQTDPLFTVDLSDPTNPTIMGALKIPGFSEYLHIWDENTLLGLGYDEYGYIKISTYDISDKYNVTEDYVMSLDEVFESIALYDHRAVFICPEKNLLGFHVGGYDLYEFTYATYNNGYRIYSYEDGQFKTVISYIVDDDYDYTSIRCLYIGDYLYLVVPDEGVHVFNMSDYANVAVVK